MTAHKQKGEYSLLDIRDEKITANCFDSFLSFKAIAAQSADVSQFFLYCYLKFLGLKWPVCAMPQFQLKCSNEWRPAPGACRAFSHGGIIENKFSIFLNFAPTNASELSERSVRGCKNGGPGGGALRKLLLI